MAKILAINFSKCVGCRECEIVCSGKHMGEFNPELSRIRIITWSDRFGSIPITCNQCISAPCLAVCPTKAIFRNESLFRVEIDYNNCIGCRSCVEVCPFGAMGFSEQHKHIFKCDVCDGDPACVEACVYNALVYVDPNEQSMTKKKNNCKDSI